MLHGRKGGTAIGISSTMIFRGGIRESVQLFWHFYSAYPVRGTLMLLSLTVAALAEGLGIAALLPVLDLVIDPEGTKGTVTLYVAKAFAMAGLELSLGGLLVVIVGMITLKAVLMLLAMAQIGYSAAHVATELRLRMIRALLDAHWRHFVDQHTGDLSSAASVEPARAASAYIQACRVLAGSIQLIIYSGLSIAISLEASIAALVVGTLGMVTLSRFVALSRRAGRGQTELQKSFMTRLLQGLDGMKALKAMAREGGLGPLMEADVRGINRAQRTMIVSREAVVELHEIIRIVAIAGGLYFFLAIWSEPVDSLFVLVLLFARTLQRAGQLQSHYQSVAASQPAFAFLQSTIAAAEGARESGPGGSAPRLASAVSLREVSFSYGRGDVLEGVSMTLPAGAFIAVVGPSGAGKTTVADLIVGLLRPQRGEVWIDDLPMRDVNTKAWRGMIGYVPQETFLFHDTIMANVTLGDAEISRVEVETALRRAGTWAFVAALPDGMDTMVGERGAKLSGGQRQRIAIARALIHDPALLILDEATTALDPETEAGIVATVRRLTGKVTVLSISHQPAMMRAADIVYRVNEGRVALETVVDQAKMRVAGVHG